MDKNIETTLQELLHSINLLGNDTDVCVDGFGWLAVCPPVSLTPKGKERFKQALNAKVIVIYNGDSHEFTAVSDDDDDIDEIAYNFIAALAGYCAADDYDQWFEGDDAEII